MHLFKKANLMEMVKLKNWGFYCQFNGLEARRKVESLVVGLLSIWEIDFRGI